MNNNIPPQISNHSIYIRSYANTMIGEREKKGKEKGKKKEKRKGEKEEGKK